MAQNRSSKSHSITIGGEFAAPVIDIAKMLMLLTCVFNPPMLLGASETFIMYRKALTV